MTPTNGDVVLYSGGPDSFITYHWCLTYGDGPAPLPFYLRMGHRYQEWEEAAIRKTLPNTVMCDVLLGLGEWEEADATIYARNAFMALAASRFVKESGRIWLTVQRDELSMPDRTVGFMESISGLLRGLCLGRDIVVISPWVRHDKTEMVGWYMRAVGREDLLVATRSCYSRSDIHCGNCPACIRRFIAFQLNGVTQEWATHPMASDVGDEYRRRAKAGEYSELRCKRTLGALGNGR